MGTERARESRDSEKITGQGMKGRKGRHETAKEEGRWKVRATERDGVRKWRRAQHPYGLLLISNSTHLISHSSPPVITATHTHRERKFLLFFPPAVLSLLIVWFKSQEYAEDEQTQHNNSCTSTPNDFHRHRHVRYKLRQVDLNLGLIIKI